MAKEISCCGEVLVCDMFTNTCPNCGADYDSGGHELAPREQWGSETGETAADILMYDGMTTDELLEGES